ncbi:hypothetical protein FSP39_020020 [Pinctada imbricata]|uniref:C3H1-type domain-containing protein n=1 Tax=Pinctada imbricata TaxID=66713 RepID=A0AA89BMQ1_PINIB|nr:hypothetical protein FSP39_020020 [Pinctada imbricata]
MPARKARAKRPSTSPYARDRTNEEPPLSPSGPALTAQSLPDTLPQPVPTPQAPSQSMAPQVISQPITPAQPTQSQSLQSQFLPANAVSIPQHITAAQLTSASQPENITGTSVGSFSLQSQPLPAPTTQFLLGYNVDASLRQKIISGNYINLGLLLKSDADDQQTVTLSISQNGELISKPPRAKKVESIDQWTQAFLIYMSIYLSAHPNKTQELVKYLHDVRLGAQRSSGWQKYDEQFRLKLSIDPTLSWAMVDSELWLLYMQPLSNLPSQNRSIAKCFAYNYQGFCQRPQCYYSHACITCNQRHPVKYCTTASTQGPRPPTNINPRFRSPHPSANRPQGRPQTYSNQSFLGGTAAYQPRQPNTRRALTYPSTQRSYTN